MKKVRNLSIVAACTVFSVLAIIPTAFSAEGAQSMYRLYNPNSGEHFYTADVFEVWEVQDAGWTFEGIGWTAPVSSSTPVYRLYNPNAGDHHYTTDPAERDMLTGVGWNYEGVGWYSDDTGAVPLYREYNPNASTGAHNFTTDSDEDSMLVAAGWDAEGVAWYGRDWQSDGNRVGNYYRIYSLDVDWSADQKMWARPSRSVEVSSESGNDISFSLHYSSRNCARMSDTASITALVDDDCASFSYRDTRKNTGTGQMIFGTDSVSLLVAESTPGRDNYLSTDGKWVLLKRMTDDEFSRLGISYEYAS